MQTSSGIRTIKKVLLITSILAIVVLLFLEGPPMASQPARRAVSLELGNFIATALTPQGVAINDIRCANSDKCELGSSASFPTYSWRLLGWTTLYRVTNEGRFRDYAMKDIEWIVNARSDLPPTVSLHQIFEALQTFDEPRLLEFYFRWSRYNLNYFNAKAATLEADLMTATAIAKQLWQFSRFTESKEQQQKLEKINPLFVSDAVRESNRTAKQVAAQLTNRIDTLALAESQSVYKCFAAWNLVEAFKATADRNYLERAKVYVEQYPFNEESLAQQVLPCLEVYTAHPELNWSESFVKEVSPFLAKTWDRGSRPLCQGDGGLFAVQISDQKKCLAAGKHTADNAWLSMILANDVKGVVQWNY